MTVNVSPFYPNAAFTDAAGRLTNEARLWLQRELVRRAQGPLTSQELADAISSIVAGEMVLQPAFSGQVFPDTVQTSPGDQFLPDIVQTSATDLGEMTWQI